MSAALVRLFARSEPGDADAARTAALLEPLLRLSIFVVLATVGVVTAIDSMPPRSLAVNGTLVAGLSSLRVLSRRGRPRLAAALVTLLFAGYATVGVFFYGGITAGTLSYFFILTLMASVLGGWTLIATAIAWSVVSTGAALIAMRAGWLPEPIVAFTPLRTWLVFLACLTGLTVLVALARGQLLRLVAQLEGENAARRDAEQELRRSQRLMAAILDNTFELQALLSPDGQLLEVNHAAVELIGVPREELIGRPFWMTPWWTHAPEEQARLRQAIARAATGEVVRFETTHRAASGQMRVVDFSLRPVHDDSGAVVYLVPEGRDVTDLKAAEELLRQSQRMETVGRLAGGIAHDFNNLLVPVLANAESLESSLHASDGRRALASDIRAAAERAASLTRQLLTFSRRQVLDLRVFELDAVIREFARILRRTIPESVEMRISLGAGGACILGDVSQIEQVLMNLAVNARDAMPGGGRIEIETTIANDRPRPEGAPSRGVVRLRFTDTGGGIPPEVLPRIFEPFFTTKGADGTGLGLSTVDGIVQQHKGTIAVTSEAGRGTAFEIAIPMADEPRDRPAPEEPGPAPGTGAVAVVEDSPAVREILCRTLDRLGYSVIPFDDPLACLESLERERPAIDLLVTDVVMPGLDGRQLFARLAERRPDLRVLYVSGYARDAIGETRDLGEREGFLQKPFTMQSLASRVREMLGPAAPRS